MDATRTPSPSDLDKPLPLEPLELRKTQSRTPSIETTITDIIDLYTKPAGTDGPSQLRVSHTVASYRNSLASLMDRRLGLDDDLFPAPLRDMGVDEYFGLDFSFTYPAWELEVEPRLSMSSLSSGVIYPSIIGHKRREKLKDSISLVGPLDLSMSTSMRWDGR
ncbi:hypothetical protein DV735_g3255, partial [Chaetothyriales sp. CBS 134920]